MSLVIWSKSLTLKIKFWDRRQEVWWGLVRKTLIGPVCWLCVDTSWVSRTVACWYQLKGLKWSSWWQTWFMDPVNFDLIIWKLKLDGFHKFLFINQNLYSSWSFQERWELSVLTVIIRRLDWSEGRRILLSNYPTVLSLRSSNQQTMLEEYQNMISIIFTTLSFIKGSAIKGWADR